MKKSFLFLTLIASLTLSGCQILNNTSSSGNGESTTSTTNPNSSETSTSSSSNSSETSSGSSETSTSSSTSHDPIYQTTAISTSNLSDGVIPTSYTSSVTTFKKDDIVLYGNYFTNDYAGGYAFDHFFLKEEKGYIGNVNEIHYLKSISFNHVINDVKVFGSIDFKKDYVEITSNNNIYEFNNEYKYFLITSTDKYFGFDELNITYEDTSSYINNIYDIKNVDTINQNEADSLVSVSSEKFTNSQYWVDKGYALNYEQAKQNTNNFLTSGYNLETDYLLEYYQDPIVDENLTSYRVADMRYGDDGNSFQINMIDGSKGPVIYKGCAYTYVEDIAAYILAFNDVPVNMAYDKNDTYEAISDWGENGRVNYNFYSNDNDKSYLYETEVSTHRYLFDPIENTNDYYYAYYESDYGASVGNDEPYEMQTNYSTSKYNDGTDINRGTLRFVYTKFYTNYEHSKKKTAEITNTYDRNVFFTTNHYNDFQQYLNYYGGWSLRFGNTTLGNPWNKYVEGNHLDASPNVKITSLANLTR